MHMLEEMDRLFEHFGVGRSPLARSTERGFGSTVWNPRVEVSERDGRLVVRADLPGVKKEDVSIELHDDRLVISGERKSEEQEEDKGYFRSEVTYGSFTRVIPLPEGVTAEDAKANFKDGVLEVDVALPKQQQRQSRKIEIGEHLAPTKH